jgi:drug/metabolite transporter (DMT)-like permease
MPLPLDLVLLVLLAAFTHALWNALVKVSGDRLVALAIVICTGSLACVGPAFFVAPPEAAAWPFLFASMALHQAYFALLLGAYRAGELNLVYPIARGSAPLLVAAAAASISGEVPAPVGALGILLASAGVASLSLGRRPRLGGSRKAVALALATGATIAGYTLMDGLGIRRAGGPWGYIVWLNMLTGVPIAAAALVAKRGQVGQLLADQWKQGLAGGLFALFAYGLVLYALSRGAMGPVAALRETSVLFAALIGAFKLKESLGARRIAAALAIAAGIVLMQAGG